MIAGAAGASKHQNFRKELTLEGVFSSFSSYASTACWAGMEDERDEGEVRAMITAVEAFCHL
jgi:hypothetical protein